jgi:hypothetical protein
MPTSPRKIRSPTAGFRLNVAVPGLNAQPESKSDAGVDPGGEQEHHLQHSFFGMAVPKGAQQIFVMTEIAPIEGGIDARVCHMFSKQHGDAEA